MKKKLDNLDDKLAKKQENLLKSSKRNYEMKTDREMRQSDLKASNSSKKERTQSVKRRNKHQEKGNEIYHIENHEVNDSYSSQKQVNLKIKNESTQRRQKRQTASPSPKFQGSPVNLSRSPSLNGKSPSDTTIQIQDIERQLTKKQQQLDQKRPKIRINQQRFSKSKEAQPQKSKVNMSQSSRTLFPSKFTSVIPSKMTSPKAGTISLIKDFVDKDRKIFQKQKKLEDQRRILQELESQVKEQSFSQTPILLTDVTETNLRTQSSEIKLTTERSEEVKNPQFADLKLKTNKKQAYQEIQQEALSNLINKNKSYNESFNLIPQSQNSPHFSQLQQQFYEQPFSNQLEDSKKKSQSQTDFIEKQYQNYQEMKKVFNLNQQQIFQQTKPWSPKVTSPRSQSVSYNYSYSQDKVKLKDLDEIISYFKQQQDNTSFQSVLSGLTSIINSKENTHDSLSYSKPSTMQQQTFMNPEPYSLAMSISDRNK